MKYNAPTGALPDAPYVNGDRSAGTKGSVVPAEAIEFPQREILAVIQAAGLTPDNADLEQLRKAILSLIDAATGGGDTAQYLLLSQARARLPIFPEVQSADGKINVSAPTAGQILVPPTVSFLHRGIFVVSTSDYTEAKRTFATAAGKTYHLRWSPNDGFALKDVANTTYNPSALAEANITFDSSYDDMLVARIVTSAANVATITNLINKTVLTASGEEVAARGTLGQFAYEDGTRPSQIGQYTAVSINFARTPQVFVTGLNDVLVNNDSRVTELNAGARPLSRYQVAVWGQGDVDIWTGWGARA